MALTIGTGPFADDPAGRFDTRPPATPLLYWEPFGKRFRVVLDGQTLADSRDALTLHETGEMMRVCVPPSDVLRDLLTPGDTTEAGRRGSLRFWSYGSGERPIDAVAQSFDAPPEAASALAGHVVFDLDKVDAWYLDDDLGYAHPRNPYHRVDVHMSSSRVVVRSGGVTIAESSGPAILYETGLPPRIYLPPDAIQSTVLSKSETVSRCPYKGDGQHWHVLAGDQRVEDAAWSLTTPIGDASRIPRWVSFYPDKVTVEVDGRKLTDAGT